MLISDISLTIQPAVALYTQTIPDTQLQAFETSDQGRKTIVIDINAGNGIYSRDIGTVLSWPTNVQTEVNLWQPSILPLPEVVYSRATDWDNGGYPGDKFIQGVIVKANTLGNAKTFFLEDSGTETMHPLNECPAIFNIQQTRAFSCVVPFVSHSARIISSDGVGWEIYESKLVFEPWPELCSNWQTELVSLGGVGWQHVREMNIAHVSTANLTLVLTFDAWPTITLTIPNSGGLQQKVKVTLPANKFKLIGFQISSSSPFRLFKEDIELKRKIWGATSAYEIIKPFGGESKVGAGV